MGVRGISKWWWDPEHWSRCEVEAESSMAHRTFALPLADFIKEHPADLQETGVRGSGTEFQVPFLLAANEGWAAVWGNKLDPLGLGSLGSRCAFIHSLTHC